MNRKTQWIGIIVVVVFLLLGLAPKAYAQTGDEANPHLLGIKDCQVTAAQVLIGEPNPRFPGQESWVGVEIGFNDGVRQIPELNPRGYEYISEIYLSDDNAVWSWIASGFDVIFYNWDGLVGYAQDGETYVLSASRCLNQGSFGEIWTNRFEYQLLNHFGEISGDTSATHYFFVGSELSQQEQAALMVVPEGYFGEVVGDKGIIDASVDGLDVLVSTLQVSSTGDLLWSPEISGVSMSTGITIPLNTEVVVITQFHSCLGTCPPPMARSIVALQIGGAFKVMGIWREYKRFDYLMNYR